MPLYRENQDCSSAIDDFIEDEPVPLSKVKVGQEYEIVLTTFTGKFKSFYPIVLTIFSILIISSSFSSKLNVHFLCRLIFSSYIGHGDQASI
jgi:hypothetical protein